MRPGKSDLHERYITLSYEEDWALATSELAPPHSWVTVFVDNTGHEYVADRPIDWSDARRTYYARNDPEYSGIRVGARYDGKQWC